MKILSSHQTKVADQATLKAQKISSYQLMERAGTALFEEIQKEDPEKPLAVFSGTGNNGGDGLVIAWLAYKSGIPVKVFTYSLKHSSAEFAYYLDHCKKAGIDVQVLMGGVFPVLSPDEIIVDCLLGAGINKEVAGELSDIIHKLNSVPNKKISVDVPSGLLCESLNKSNDLVIKADLTLTIEYPKLSFMFPENLERLGLMRIIDIRLDDEFLKDAETEYHYTTKADILQFYKPRAASSHKGNFGHSLLIAGSNGKIGAALLAAKGCIASGSGLTTLHIPNRYEQLIYANVPEVMVEVDECESCFSSLSTDLTKFNSVAIGPGIGKEEKTAKALKLLIQNSDIPLILDADAINLISENSSWLPFLPENSIITPHPKEFERLAGKFSDSYERLKAAQEFSMRNKIITILKGARTAVIAPNGKVYFNSTGNPGLAKGGSGDLLTGILAGLVAQNYSPLKAAILGVYLHGLAADLAIHKCSVESLTATEVALFIGNAYNTLKSS